MIVFVSHTYMHNTPQSQQEDPKVLARLLAEYGREGREVRTFSPEVETLRRQLKGEVATALATENPQPVIEELCTTYEQFLGDPDAPYVEELPDTAPGISLGDQFRLRMGFCNQKDGSGDYGKGHNFLLNLYEGSNPESLAAFTVREESPGHFNIAHRLVDADYRGTRAGKWILSLIERFVQTMAQRRGREQVLEANIGQRHLMAFLLLNDFEADDPAMLKGIVPGLKSGDLIEWGPKRKDKDGMEREYPEAWYLYRADTPPEERLGLKTKPEYVVKIRLKKTFVPSGGSNF